MWRSKNLALKAYILRASNIPVAERQVQFSQGRYSSPICQQVKPFLIGLFDTPLYAADARIVLIEYRAQAVLLTTEGVFSWMEDIQEVEMNGRRCESYIRIIHDESSSWSIVALPFGSQSRL